MQKWMFGILLASTSPLSLAGQDAARIALIKHL